VAAKETDDAEPPIPKTREKQKAARKDFRKVEGWVTFNSAQGFGEAVISVRADEQKKWYTKVTSPIKGESPFSFAVTRRGPPHLPDFLLQPRLNFRFRGHGFVGFVDRRTACRRNDFLRE
jgi:hypothetical protein